MLWDILKNLYFMKMPLKQETCQKVRKVGKKGRKVGQKLSPPLRAGASPVIHHAKIDVGEV